MSADMYEPRPETLPARVVAYFRRLPEEELSSRDIGLKFDTEPGNVHLQLKAGVEHGLFKRDGVIYSAGPNIGKASAASIKLSDTTPPPSAAPPRARPVRRAELPDPTDIKLDDDVPLPAGRGGPKVDWDPLLERMKVNQSCLLPLNARHTLSNAITARHKAQTGKYTLRKLDAEQLRVWRVA
jgi:hypothetical protein